MANCRRLGLASVVALALTATACGGGDDAERRDLDLGGASASQEPESPSASSPDETSSDGAEEDAIATSYPDVGLEFTSLPEPTDEQRPALLTYVAYERGLRQSGRTNRMNALVTDNAIGQARDFVQGGIDFRREEGTTYRGETRVEVESLEVEAPVATIGICLDAADLELVTDGQVRPVEGQQVLPVTVTLNSPDGAWVVADYAPQDGSC